MKELGGIPNGSARGLVHPAAIGGTPKKHGRPVHLGEISISPREPPKEEHPEEHPMFLLNIVRLFYCRVVVFFGHVILVYNRFFIFLDQD